MIGWWKQAVVYQIYPRSFQDSNDDGIGDIKGLISRLGVLSELGVNTIWCSPLYPSPQKDFGYDISNYKDIDPIFGNLEDFDCLILALKSKNIRLIMDGVFNHTSDQHPWFQSALDPLDSHHEWYHWAKEKPNNWSSAFGGAAWTKHPSNNLYYLHSFAKEQPDLNWANPEVRKAVHEVMNFWLDKGVSGFRLDVFNCYAKDPERKSNPTHSAWWRRAAGIFYPYIGQNHIHDRDVPALHGYLKELREVVKVHNAILVGETLDESFVYDKAADYVSDAALHSAFNFRLLHSQWGAKEFQGAISSYLDALGADQIPCWAMSNHDFPRMATRWGQENVKAALLLLFALPGVPFLYSGDEIGMKDGRLKRHQIRDPIGRKYWPFFKGRDGCRTPMQWSNSPFAGFSTVKPWLPVNSDVSERNVCMQRKVNSSIWNWTKVLIHLRLSTPGLRSGSCEWVTDTPDRLHLCRTFKTERWEIIINMGKKNQDIVHSGELILRSCSSSNVSKIVPSEARLYWLKTPTK